MAPVFWDMKGILLIDYLEKRETIIEENYAFFLDRLKTAIADKCPGMAKKMEKWLGKIEWTALWTSFTFSLFTRSGFFGLPSILKTWNFSSWMEICVQRRSHPGSQRLLREPWRKLLLGRNREPKETLGQVRWSSMRLCHVKGQSSGLNLVKVHQSVWKRYYQLGKFWLVFFGMYME